MNVEMLLKKSRLRVTGARITLLRALDVAKKPLTVEELYSKNKINDLVTVYRTVRSLVSAGLVREVHFKDSTVRYEFVYSGKHHHHLVCSGCGFIEELPKCNISIGEKKVLQYSLRFASVEEHLLEFFGKCKTCVKS